MCRGPVPMNFLQNPTLVTPPAVKPTTVKRKVPPSPPRSSRGRRLKKRIKGLTDCGNDDGGKDAVDGSTDDTGSDEYQWFYKGNKGWCLLSIIDKSIFSALARIRQEHTIVVH